LPEGTKGIPWVWAMRHKQQITDGKVHKWKSRLNVDGSKLIKSVNFWETYAPVAQWISIRLILSIAVMKKWKVKPFDFVQAFPPALSQTELFINVPRGCNVGSDNSKWALKVISIANTTHVCCGMMVV
jgi:Reverse transcriptase (RNA-dependent DNA polymerase)